MESKTIKDTFKTLFHGSQSHNRVLQEQLNQEKQRREDAEKALELFKDHLETCSVFIFDDKDCDCGLDKALAHFEQYKQ